MFQNRTDAGRRLAQRLTWLHDADVVVLGLPRGGVVVAAEVAHALAAPLDVIVVRKLGVPFQPEVAMGAVGEEGVRVLNPSVLNAAGITPEELDRVERAEREELDRRVQRYRHGRDAEPLAERTVVIVDDGIATGATAHAACEIARARGAARVVLAVPVAAADIAAELRAVADDVVCAETPQLFLAVGEHYSDFRQTSDEEVVALLEGFAHILEGGAPAMTAMKRWTIEVFVGEDEGRTYAEARLADNDIGDRLIGVGRAKLNPDDRDVPEIGDELAVARALSDLGHRLLVVAAGDIQRATKEKVRLTH
jgi:putative phosphoribosyl transferase